MVFGGGKKKKSKIGRKPKTTKQNPCPIETAVSENEYRRRESKDKYIKSENGKNAQRKYQTSQKGKNALKNALHKYQGSQKGKNALSKYQTSQKGLVAKKKSIANYQGSTRKKAAIQNYKNSTKGKQKIRTYMGVYMLKRLQKQRSQSATFIDFSSDGCYTTTNHLMRHLISDAISKRFTLDKIMRNKILKGRKKLSAPFCEGKKISLECINSRSVNCCLVP